MSGTYYKVKPDGADWRCKECKELKPAGDVLVQVDTETQAKTLFCLDCVDPEWLKTAKCLRRL